MNRKMRGFTMIEVLIVGTILGVVVAFTGTLILQVFRNQRKDEISSIYTVLRDNFIDQFRDPSAWQEIWAHNNGTLAAAYTPVRVYGADGLLYMGYDPNIPTNGFDLNGQLCNTYSAAAPDPNCPFRLVFNWRQRAGTGSCVEVQAPCNLPPDIDVEARAQVSQGSTATVTLINPDKFYLLFTRSGSHVNVQQINCPAGSLVQGFDNNGNPICVTAASVDLAANPPPPPPPPPAILAVGGPAVGEPAVGGPAAGSPAPKSPAKGK